MSGSDLGSSYGMSLAGVLSIKLKMLKFGGTLSKAHSVCVPSKLTKLRKLPLKVEEAGEIYYSKPSRNGAPKTHKVRPRIVYALWLALSSEKDGCVPYVTKREQGDPQSAALDEMRVSWDDDRARKLFREHAGAATKGGSVEVEAVIEFPSIVVGDEPEEDVGPAAGQHPGASDEAHETSSGFVDLIPSADVQASIDRALNAARGQGDGTRSRASRSSIAPVFHVTGEDTALSEFDDYFFSMGFPEVFLDGSGDFNRPRLLELKIDEWLEHLMWSGDQRAARHRILCFVAFSVMQRWRAMNQGSFFVGVHVNRRQHSDGSNQDPISLEELNERVKDGDNSLAQAVYYWSAVLRGSHACVVGARLTLDRWHPPPVSRWLDG